MDKDTLIKNAIGTCFNVLQEQGRDNLDPLVDLLKMLDADGPMFDLRYRELDGSDLKK
jgi:hypothetical protein